MNEPGTIPGLDLPDMQAPTEKKNMTPNQKNPVSAKTVFHDQEDEKIGEWPQGSWFVGRRPGWGFYLLIFSISFLFFMLCVCFIILYFAQEH